MGCLRRKLEQGSSPCSFASSSSAKIKNCQSSELWQNYYFPSLFITTYSSFTGMTTGPPLRCGKAMRLVYAESVAHGRKAFPPRSALGRLPVLTLTVRSELTLTVFTFYSE